MSILLVNNDFGGSVYVLLIIKLVSRYNNIPAFRFSIEHFSSNIYTYFTTNDAIIIDHHSFAMICSITDQI
jgi:hypothetical protein